MECQPIRPVSFGYHHKLKDLYKQGLLPVTKGLYGGDLSKSCTLEHILPHSKGGKTTLSNLALATMENNMLRGSDDITKYLTKDVVREYLNQFVDVELKGFNGNNYIKMITQRLKKLGLNL